MKLKPLQKRNLFDQLFFQCLLCAKNCPRLQKNKKQARKTKTPPSVIRSDAQETNLSNDDKFCGNSEADVVARGAPDSELESCHSEQHTLTVF